MKKAMLMKSAHRIAKEINWKVGNYSIALSIALKEVWRQVKAYDKKRFGEVAIISAAARLTAPKVNNSNVYGIPSWIIRKNLSQEESYAVINQSSSMTVVRETEKAEYVEFDTDFGKVQMWTPKSILVA